MYCNGMRSNSILERFPSLLLFQRTLSLFSTEGRRSYFRLVLAQTMTNVLDLIGVGLVGLVGALGVRGVSSTPPGNSIQFVLRILNLQNENLQTQVAILSGIALAALVTKTLLSIYLSRKIYKLLGDESINISVRLTRKLLSLQFLQVQTRTTQAITFRVNEGSNALVLNIPGLLAGLIADLFLLGILLLALCFVSWTMAAVSLIFFGGFSIVLYLRMHGRAEHLGSEDARLSIQSQSLFLQVFNSFRDTVVRDSRYFYAKKIQETQESLIRISAERLILPNISKFAIEIATLVGICVVAALQFILTDATHAVATIAVFMATASRVAPASLRIQQGLIQIKANFGLGKPTLELIEELKELPDLAIQKNLVDRTYAGYVNEIQVENVRFKYPNTDTFKMSIPRLTLNTENFIAVVGPSGGGKSTFIDLLLGVIDPDEGKIQISKHAPQELIRRWPGIIGYVPQEVQVINGSILENLLFGISKADVSDTEVLRSIQLASLTTFIDSLPDGLETRIGNSGQSISGGQKQRLGIARALVTRPRFLVLDEATSALDASTEAEVSESLEGISKETKLIVVAHRLSTVRRAELILYIDEGQVTAKGTFEDLLRDVPQFAINANLMGIN